MLPQTNTLVTEGELTIPAFYETVKTLDQVVPVDYIIPGCPPEPSQIWSVMEAVIAGAELPSPGCTVIGASDVALCEQCPLEKHEKQITHFYRPYELIPEPGLCLLEQGLFCMGPATRGGCGALCPQAGMGCRGCYGPLNGVADQGARMLSALASAVDIGAPDDEEQESRTQHLGCYGYPGGPGRDLLSLRYGSFAAHTRQNLRQWPGARRCPMKRVSIDPITRLEGHGKIEIFLDDEGEVANAYFQVPELRGFERFCVGRPAEEMPRITNRICGVCPEAHHMAATKALDALFHVEPSSAAKKVRELFYSAFFVTDHTTHFYALGGPDFVVGPDAPAAERNILGVIHKVGLEIGKQVIACRAAQPSRDRNGRRAGQCIRSPGCRAAGAKRSAEEQHQEIEQIARENVDFALFSLEIFKQIVLENPDYVDLILSDSLHSPDLFHGHGGCGKPGQLLRWR